MLKVTALDEVNAERIGEPRDVTISVSHHQALTEHQRSPRDERIPAARGSPCW
jgi:hypothetical protein